MYLDGVTPEELVAAYPEATLTAYTSTGGACGAYSIDTAALQLSHGRIHVSRHRAPTPEEIEAATAATRTEASGYVFRALAAPEPQS